MMVIDFVLFVGLMNLMVTIGVGIVIIDELKRKQDQ